MDRLPAISGWYWIRDGIAIWRRQPNALGLVFLMYLSLNLLLLVVPYIGPLLVLLLNQVLTTAYMLACAKVDAGDRAHPRQLFAYFRAPAFWKLAGLGICYALASFFASTAMSWFAGPALVSTMLNANSAVVALDPVAQVTLVESFMLGSVVYLLLIIPLWFAAPLMAWQGMGFAKAIFFSFFSTLRSAKAFIVYVFCWILINLFVVINVMAILGLLGMSSNAAVLSIMIPSMLILAMLRYCSYYTSYVQVFGKPQFPAEA